MSQKGLIATRPICFFDTETTGTNTEIDRIVELAVVKLFPDGTIKEARTLINPQMPIPLEASEVHGITDEMVKDAKPFSEVAVKLSAFMSDCDLAGHNISSFDIPLLSNEFNRCGIIFPSPDQKFLDTYKNECRINERTLSACYKRYTGKDLEGAHGALADTHACLDVLISQCEGEDITVDELAEAIAGSNVDWAGKMKYNDAGFPCWAFGKNFGKIIFDDADYLKWFINSGNAPRQTLFKIEEEKEIYQAMLKDLHRAKSEKELEDQETK